MKKAIHLATYTTPFGRSRWNTSSKASKEASFRDFLKRIPLKEFPWVPLGAPGPGDQIHLFKIHQNHEKLPRYYNF
jgi:hypothetical protein